MAHCCLPRIPALIALSRSSCSVLCVTIRELGHISILRPALFSLACASALSTVCTIPGLLAGGPIFCVLLPCHIHIPPLRNGVRRMAPYSLAHTLQLWARLTAMAIAKTDHQLE